VQRISWEFAPDSALEEATVKRYFFDTHEHLEAHLTDFPPNTVARPVAEL
jgi:hypothetical protein